MSIAVTHRPHLHVPAAPVVATLAAIVVAAAVLVLVNQPSTTTVSSSDQAQAVAATRTQIGKASGNVIASVAAAPAALPTVQAAAGDAAVVSMPETLALRRHILQQHALAVSQSEQFTYPRNHIVGVTLDRVAPAQSSASQPVILTVHHHYATNDPHPLNHFPGQP